MTGSTGVSGPGLVWYAAYGSNLCRERFLRYLQGGTVPNSVGTMQHGARDPAPPLSDRPYAIPRALYFAGTSTTWGDGGVAYLDADRRADDPTLGRLWLITTGQFEDVYRQENRLPVGWSEDVGLRRHWSELSIDRSAVPADGNYCRLLLLDHLDDTPVVTFTSAHRRADVNPPHETYRAVITRGLEETWDLDTDETRRYLARVVEG